MFDTMKATKVLASLAGALLFLLLMNWGASALYMVGPGESHAAEGEQVAAVQGYVIAPVGGDAAATTETTAPMSFEELFAMADVDKGKKVFAKCKSCHKIDEGVNSTGPSLYGVVGRAVGTEAGFTYSDAVAGLGGDWTPDRLNEWLTDPKAYAPGNKMTFVGLNKPQDRANIIAYLASIAG